MEDKRIDELLENEMMIDVEDMKRTEKMIERGMSKRIIRKSLIVSIVVVLVFGCVIIGKQRMDAYFAEKNAFHLSDYEMVVDDPTYGYTFDQRELEVMNAFVYMNTYLSLFYPGIIASKEQPNFNEPYQLDYGSYEIDAYIYDLFEVSAAGSDVELRREAQHRVLISNQNIWLDEWAGKEVSYQSYKQQGRSLGSVWISEEQRNDMLHEIQQLPDTAIVSLDVMLSESVTLDEVLEYQRSHTDSRVVYVVTYYDEDWDEELLNYPYGFSLVQGMAWAKLSYEVAEKYPNLILSDRYHNTDVNDFWSDLPEYTSEELVEHYLSCMKLLVNNEAGLYYDEELSLIIDDVEENGVEVHGYRIFASKEDALALYEDENVNTIVIKDVKYSKYQK
ncbi:MAG: hypothetical protein E7191_07565 [Erysipelotrichaceae bacterium]|nr:hypothetical protein [Erysipelotrichaceae bacterium]